MISKTFSKSVTDAIEQLEVHKKFARACEVNEEMLKLHDDTISIFDSLISLSKEESFSTNYIHQLNTDIRKTLFCFPYRRHENSSITNETKKEYKERIEDQSKTLESQLKLLNFTIDFFNKFGFFNKNIVAIGANGSGKTTLTSTLKKYLPKNGVVISAQKVLIIPTFSSISNYDNTSKNLEASQVADKSLKVTYTTENKRIPSTLLNMVSDEFKVLLDNLIAERSVKRNKFCDEFNKGKINKSVPLTKLDTALDIWNSLIQHRVIECKDGINITLKEPETKKVYAAHKMSDGEKVVLYLIAHTLQAPKSGFIIVDEPEMYLHKTILQKLWNILEKERQDCIFIYLTHDLDFAVSRIAAKKVWIRSFSYPDKWDIKNVPYNDLPKPLLLELLGSRKKILFCEGEKGGLDEKIYNILFSDYTITPVVDCHSVINYTKAFNKIPNSNTSAIGIIDSDHHGTKRLMSLSSDSIFSYSITEPESLFMDEEFLILLSTQLLKNDSVVEKIKSDVLSQLQKDIEVQTSNYITAKINYYFNSSHMSKGNTVSEVKKNYDKFNNHINISQWYDDRKVELENIISTNDYNQALAVYNNKGLQAIVNKHFKIKDFIDRAINFLEFNTTTHSILIKHFPSELSPKHNKKIQRDIFTQQLI